MTAIRIGYLRRVRVHLTAIHLRGHCPGLMAVSRRSGLMMLLGSLASLFVLLITTGIFGE